MSTYRPSVMNASLRSDSIETVLPGMLVSSIGRVDMTHDLFRVGVTSRMNDTRVVGVIHSVPEFDIDTSSEYHDITICPIRQSVISSDSTSSASNSDDTSAPTFQFTPVWVLFDPTAASSSQPMTRISPGSLLTSSPIPGFAMAQTYSTEGTEGTEGSTDSRIIYYTHTIGRAVASCFPTPNLRDCIAKGELHIQPDYLQFKVQRDITEVEPTIYNIYGHFSDNAYVGKTLRAGLIPAIVG